MDVKAYTPIQDFSCVDRDLHGCGNFSNVQSAIDVVPDLSSSKTLIIVNSGSYRSYLQLQALVLFPLSPLLNNFLL